MLEITRGASSLLICVCSLAACLISNNNQNQIKQVNDKLNSTNGTILAYASDFFKNYDESAIPSDAVVYITDGAITTSGLESYSGSLTIPSSYSGVTITVIGDYAFRSCTGLESVTFEEGSQLESIGEYAFYGCSGLISINIPDNVSSIGEYAFENCSSLNSIEIPNSVTSIVDGTFYGCTSLTDIELPDGLTSIGNSAFSACTSLESISIPENVTSIESWAFENCSSLSSITLNWTAEQLNSSELQIDSTWLFNHDISKYTTIHIPANTTEAYEDAITMES